MPHRLLLRICFFGYFVIGLVITVIGPVIPALQEVFGLTRGEVGAVFVAQGVGYALAVLIGGILSDLLGRLPVLVAGTAVLSAGFLAFGTVTTWPVALLFFLLPAWAPGLPKARSTASLWIWARAREDVSSTCFISFLPPARWWALIQLTSCCPTDGRRLSCSSAACSFFSWSWCF